MVNLAQTAGWRVVDIAHHELRWSDILLSRERSADSRVSHAQPHEIPQRFEVSRAPLYELTELCELACASRGHAHSISTEREHIIDSVIERFTLESSQITSFALSAHSLSGGRSGKQFNQSDSYSERHQLRLAPHAGRALQLLEGSREVGLLEQYTQRDTSLWVHTPQGESQPHTLLSERLTRYLTPEVVIGERATPPLIRGVLWIRDPGRGALFNATLNQLISELPFAQGGSIGAHFATLIGVHEPEISQREVSSSRETHVDEDPRDETRLEELSVDKPSVGKTNVDEERDHQLKASLAHSRLNHRPNGDPNDERNHGLTDGIWAVLDLGINACSWSLIEVDHSLDPQRVQLYELSTEGRDGLGERSLFRALLNDELVTRGQLWEEVSHADRRRWIDYIQAQVDELVYAAWPDHLKMRLTPPQHTSSVTSTSALRIMNQIKELLYSEISTWIDRSLRRHELGPEALRGVWVTGRMGGALLQRLKSSLPTVNVKLAQPHVAMIGAQRYLRALNAQDEIVYEFTEVARRSLLLCCEDGSTQLLIREGASLPTIIEALVKPESGQLSLSARGESDMLVVIAEHPPLDRPQRLVISYEGPHLFCLEWLEVNGSGDDQSRSTSHAGGQPTWGQWSFR